MISKCFEVRDRMTFIPVAALRLTQANEGQRYLLRRAGYGLEEGQIATILINLDRGECQNDPYKWKDARTMPVAHQWIHDHFAELQDGAVIDVEFILGESSASKKSERERVAS